MHFIHFDPINQPTFPAELEARSAFAARAVCLGCGAVKIRHLCGVDTSCTREAMSDSASGGGTLDPHAAANGDASDGHAAGRGEDTDHYLDAPHAFDVTVRVADASTGLAIAGASVVLEALPAVQPPAHTQRGSQPFTVQVHSAVTDDAGTSSIVSEWSRDSGDVLRVRVDAPGYQSAVQSLPSSMGKVHFVDVNLHHPSSTKAPRRSRTGSASPQKSRPRGGQLCRRARASTGGLRGSTRRGRAARGGRTRRGGTRVGASHCTRPHTSDGTKRPAGFSSDLKSFANEQLARCVRVARRICGELSEVSMNCAAHTGLRLVFVGCVHIAQQDINGARG